MNEDLNRMLQSPDKGASEASGVLAKLWRLILAERNITPLAWNELMKRYLNDPRNGIPADVRERSSARGNLHKELKRPRMTWKVFLKGLRFLNPPFGMEFSVKLYWQKETATVHTLRLGDGQMQLNDDADAPDDADSPDMFSDEYEAEHMPPTHHMSAAAQALVNRHHDE